MTEGRRLRRLLLSVAALTACLVLLSRWAGRGTPPESGDLGRDATARGGAPSAGGAASQDADIAGDLTFFQALDKAGSAESSPPMVRGPADQPANGTGGATAYVVQAMATGDAAAARRVRDRLGRGGLRAVIVEDRRGDKVTYRVRVGRYRERTTAEGVARRLRDDFSLSPWILTETD